ncbi:MAG: hypothetical protein N0E48_12925 [Candidatus Thiodiazotropha endolucinida]|nr:hypothetical protein [Candidatus Thiodiazotropha taylori]MCW4344233.1 hypothetical protein [Candidatus Thiodiazotropha endolucinida]
MQSIYFSKPLWTGRKLLMMIIIIIMMVMMITCFNVSTACCLIADYKKFILQLVENCLREAMDVSGEVELMFMKSHKSPEQSHTETNDSMEQTCQSDCDVKLIEEIDNRLDLFLM